VKIEENFFEKEKMMLPVCPKWAGGQHSPLNGEN